MILRTVLALGRARRAVRRSPPRRAIRPSASRPIRRPTARCRRPRFRTTTMTTFRRTSAPRPATIPRPPATIAARSRASRNIRRRPRSTATAARRSSRPITVRRATPARSAAASPNPTAARPGYPDQASRLSAAAAVSAAAIPAALSAGPAGLSAGLSGPAAGRAVSAGSGARRADPARAGRPARRDRLGAAELGRDPAAGRSARDRQV